jgi:hypothetical protein
MPADMKALMPFLLSLKQGVKTMPESSSRAVALLPNVSR